MHTFGRTNGASDQERALIGPPLPPERRRSCRPAQENRRYFGGMLWIARKGAQDAWVITDAHLSYTGLADHLAGHSTVDHSKEYVRGMVFHTNFAESYHSLLKRGIVGAFHHVSEKHLGRYLAEFDRRWNSRSQSDGERCVNVIITALGKRLKYDDMVA